MGFAIQAVIASLAAAAIAAPLRRTAPKLALAVWLGSTTISLGLYAHLGSPNLADRPLVKRLADAESLRAARPNQAAYVQGLPALERPEIDPAYSAQLDALRRMATRNNDIQALSLLIDHEAALGNYDAALAAIANLEAQGQTIAPRRKLDLLVTQARGYVSPEAEALARRSLVTNGADYAALYYLGLMYFQTGRPDLALALLQPIPQDAVPANPYAQLAAELWLEAARDLGSAAQLGDTLFLPTLSYIPETNQAAQDLIVILAAIGQTQAAHEIWNRGRARDPDGFDRAAQIAGIRP